MSQEIKYSMFREHLFVVLGTPLLFASVACCRLRGRADIMEFARQAVEYPHRRFQILLRSTMGPIDVYLVRFVLFLFVLFSCTLRIP